MDSQNLKQQAKLLSHHQSNTSVTEQSTRFSGFSCTFLRISESDRMDKMTKKETTNCFEPQPRWGQFTSSGKTPTGFLPEFGSNSLCPKTTPWVRNYPNLPQGHHLTTPRVNLLRLGGRMRTFYRKGWRGGWVGHELCLGGVGGWVSVVGGLSGS